MRTVSGCQEEIIVTIPVNEIVKFVNEYSQLVLEVEGEATTEGTRVEQYTGAGKDHQQWRLKPAGPGSEDFYNIENVHSTMSLEVVNYSKNPGAEIVQRPYDTGPLHRQWKLVPVAGKTEVYKIENWNSGLVIDDAGGQTNAPAPVKQYESWDDDGRQPQTTPPARLKLSRPQHVFRFTSTLLECGMDPDIDSCTLQIPTTHQLGPET
jgi:hypothetical protein